MTTWIPPGKRTIGTCSICGGPVIVPDIWLGIVPPDPECGSCGAVKRESHGPVIDMQPVPPPTTRILVSHTGTSTAGGAFVLATLTGIAHKS